MDLDSELVKVYTRLIEDNKKLSLKHSEIAEAYKVSLDELLQKFNAQTIVTKISNDKKLTKSTVSNPIGFKSNLNTLLTTIQIPLIASDLREQYNKRFKTNFDKVGFSPKLSTAVGSVIEKHVEAGYPIEKRNFYGLIEWFENGKLKPEYLEKIKAGQQAQLL